MDNNDKINHGDKKVEGKVSTTGKLPQVVTITSLLPTLTATSSNVTETGEKKAGKEVKKDKDQNCLIYYHQWHRFVNDIHKMAPRGDM